MHEHARHWLDAAAVITAATTIAGWLPPIAALMSIIWLFLQMKDRAERKRKEREANDVR